MERTAQTNAAQFVTASLGQSVPTDTTSGAGLILEAMEAVWRKYAAVMEAEGVPKKQLARVSDDTVGFAMMEVLRTSLGFAGARDPGRRIRDAAALQRYQEATIGFVRACMLHPSGKGVPLLLDELRKLG